MGHLEHVQATSDSARDKSAASKQENKLRKIHMECQDWERDVLLPLAQKRISLDLDDGVKVNYVKFSGAVSPIPGLKSKSE